MVANWEEDRLGSILRIFRKRISNVNAAMIPLYSFASFTALAMRSTRMPFTDPFMCLPARTTDVARKPLERYGSYERNCQKTTLIILLGTTNSGQCTFQSHGMFICVRFAVKGGTENVRYRVNIFVAGSIRKSTRSMFSTRKANRPKTQTLLSFPPYSLHQSWWSKKNLHTKRTKNRREKRGAQCSSLPISMTMIATKNLIGTWSKEI
mmetsp:Transcript_28002/g.65751  ORF Transcript_28002/g.65751 Transcript_28002/m.65751 type:complete len:208 (-) Transcript_28002:677-1300(-)